MELLQSERIFQLESTAGVTPSNRLRDVQVIFSTSES